MYDLSVEAGMLLYIGDACWLTGAIESFWHAVISVGTVTLEKFVLVFHGAQGAPAMIEGSACSDSRVAPPPIEWPATPLRLASTRPAIAVPDVFDWLIT